MVLGHTSAAEGWWAHTIGEADAPTFPRSGNEPPTKAAGVWGQCPRI